MLKDGLILLACKMADDAKALLTQAINQTANDPANQEFLIQLKDGLMAEGKALLKETLMKQGQAQIQQAIMAGL